MNRKGAISTATASLALAALLTGCATVRSVTGIGDAPTMDRTLADLRESLPVTPAAMARPPAYTPVGTCTYRQTMTLLGQAPQVETYTLGVKQVRDRLLVSIVGRRGNSTALIERSGALHDFNLLNADGTRWTSDNYRQRAAQQVAGTREKYGPSAHSINDFTALFPQFLSGHQQVGDIVAEVLDESGSVWASYVYRGTTQFDGRSAILLDLQHRFETRPGNPVATVGFDVLDATTMTPLLFVIDAGHRLRIERVSCP